MSGTIPSVRGRATGIGPTTDPRRGTTVELTHLDIRAALAGAAFPADGDDLVGVARVHQAAPEVVEALDRLRADEVYDSVEEVLDELNIDHTAIDDTTTLRAMLGMGADDPDPDHRAVLGEDVFEDEDGTRPSLPA